MFQVVPEPEFSLWYESLPGPLAEEVTTAIDLAASEGGLAPTRLSRLVLWFDGTVAGSSAPGSDAALSSKLRLAHAEGYLSWHDEVTTWLESRAFERHFAELEPDAAASALERLERLRAKLRAARLSGNLGSLWARPGQAGPALASLRESLLELVHSVGLHPELGLVDQSGLRELRLEHVRPGLRILFGVDCKRRRLLAILGESLDRAYYGDSVLRAARRFREYLAEAAMAAQP